MENNVPLFAHLRGLFGLLFSLGRCLTRNLLMLQESVLPPGNDLELFPSFAGQPPLSLVTNLLA